MAAEDDAESREFDPSSRRLERAREEGDAPRSEEVQAAIAFAALALGIAALGHFLMVPAGEAALVFLQHPHALSLSADSLLRPLTSMFLPVLFLVSPGICVLIWLFASRGFVVAPSKIAIKWSRVSPLSNAKQKFGPAGMVDFARRSIKLAAIGTVLVYYLRHISDDLVLSLRLDPGQLSVLMVRRLIDFLWIVAALGALFGIVDILWQRHQFLKRNRMSRKEMTDEMKESEGDPHLKADRKRRAQEIANRKMLVEVQKADVVIVNPTHFAVALKWDRKKGSAPKCVAKGADEVAAKIRELARAAGVPIHHDPPTARALFASLDIGQEIEVEHYKAVAAAIRFADAMRPKSGRPMK